MVERTGYEGDDLEKLLERLDEVANFKKAGFGFPNDRIRIISKHLSGVGEKDPFTELTVGEDIHPDDFIRNTTKLYRQSWFNPVLAEVRRRLVLEGKLEERRMESAALRQKNTEEKAKLDNLNRMVAETQERLRSLEEDEKGLRRAKHALVDDIKSMRAKKAILAGELPTEVRASKRKLEL